MNHKRNATLTPDEVRRIRGLRAAGIPRRKLAALFGVSESALRAIDDGKSWVDVEGMEDLSSPGMATALKELQEMK